MSTNYFRLAPPFTSVFPFPGAAHTILTVFVNRSNAGRLTVRNEEVASVLLALCRTDPAMRTSCAGVGRPLAVEYDDDFDGCEPDTILVSEFGQVTDVAAVEKLASKGGLDAAKR